MRELLKESLTETEFTVDIAETGKEALHRINLGEYHVALIDLSLEDMNGLDVVDALIDGAPDTRIIIMTGYPSIQTAIDALRRGAQDYIIKPFKMPEIQAAVARGLRGQKLEAEVRALRLKVRDQEQEITILRANGPGRPVAGGLQTQRPAALPGGYGAPRPQPPPPIAEPDAATVNEPIIEPDTTLVDAPVAEPDATPVTAPVAEPDATPVTEPVAEPDATPVTEPEAASVTEQDSENDGEPGNEEQP